MIKKISLILVLFVLLLTPISQANADSARTKTKYLSSVKTGVQITPYISADKKNMYIDFEDFNGVEYVYYSLQYTRSNGVGDMVQGSFIPTKALYSGYFKNKPYIRQSIFFGTCSGNRCIVYKIKDVKLTVNTKMKNGKHYSNVITFPNDQF